MFRCLHKKSTWNTLLGGGRVWLERRSPLLLPFEVPSQGTSPPNSVGRTFRVQKYCFSGKKKVTRCDFRVTLL